LPSNYSAKGLEEADEILNIINMDEQARIDYDAHQKVLAISHNVIETAKIEGIAEGKAEGIVVGKVEGKAEGIVVGKAEGLIEKEEEIVCAAYKKVKDLDFVAEITSLTNDQVVAILKKNELM
jgi:flagellar biosynthesis/type III secretory pathway protein FliH